MDLIDQAQQEEITIINDRVHDYVILIGESDGTASLHHFTGTPMQRVTFMEEAKISGRWAAGYLKAGRPDVVGNDAALKQQVSNKLRGKR